ncbi:MAG: putative Ig domain-containing protein [Proteobacteria bacterium]|nr:putative Ig domain-containing protein [Pseudomonadota bacterium]
MPPGVYTVTFSKSGYQTITKTNVTVTAGQATTLDVQLPISLSGTVRDMSTDNPITSVTVSTLGTNTQTDINGYYALGSLSPGVYDVAFSKSGYQTITVTNVVVTAGQGTTLNTYLTTPGPLNITTSNLAPAEVNVAYNDRVRITGGTWPYIYSVASGTLPPGLALDTSYGNISGTPTTAGSYTFTIGVIDKLNAYAEREFTLVVTQQLTITTSSLTRGAKGMPYSFSIQASGGSQPYNFINSTQHTYNLKASSVLWSSAKSLCESSGGYLATITSSDENSTVTNLAVQSGKDAWIGFTDSESEGKWKWVTIESVTYTHWASGEPNNDGDEDCGEIRKDANPSYYWNDAKCSESQNYICEYDGLPPGVYLYTNGNVAGTPLKTDTYQFTVEVLDDSGRTEEKTFTLYVDDPLTITTSRLNDGVIGSDYNQTLNASGGYGAYNWSIYSGNLPSGLSLDSKTGIISGTPTEATYTTIVLSVSDDDDRITYKDFTIQVVNPLQILTTSLPDGLKNEYYSEAIRLDGGIKPFTFSYAGQLPAGLTLNTSTGVISGTPTASGLTNVSITVTDSTYPTHQSVTQNLSIRITTQLVITTSAVLPNAKKGITINPILLVAKGGVSPYSWALITGLMPAGMNLNQQTGELTGLPTNKGDFVFTINVTDTNGATAQKEFFWHVSDTLSIMTGAIPDGAKDIPYSFTLIATGGLQPYSWRLKNGTLPTGLSINGSTGTISGNPTTKQTFSFTIEVSDSDSPAQTAEKTYIMEVLDDLYIYTKTIPNGRINEPYTTTVMAKLGTPPYSWRLESGVLPTGFTLITSPSVATLEGTPTASGTYTFSLEVSDSGTPVKHATRQFTIDIYGDVKFETTALKTANRGIPYSDNIIVSGGTLPYSYKLTSGNLPQGLTLNSTSGHISGTPDSTTSQSSTFTVRVIDSGSPPDSVEKEFVIYVVDPLSITTQDIQSALQKSFYQTTFSGQGGLSPYHWSIQSGNLPQGLQLDEATGVLSGIPVVCGTFDFTVQLTDSSPVPNTTMKTFNLNVVCSDGYELSGKVSTLSDVIMVLSGNTSATTTTDTSGSYKFQHLTNGTYTVTPSKSGYTFNPTNRQVTINGGNQTGIDFTALALSFVTNISSVTVPVPTRR